MANPFFWFSDHPGGEKAIMLYAGRDATEEFNSKLLDLFGCCPVL